MIYVQEDRVDPCSFIQQNHIAGAIALYRKRNGETKGSGETLMGVSVVVVEKPGVGVLTNALYISNSFKASERLYIDYGLRFSSYSILGGDMYNIYYQNQLVDSVKLSEGKIGKTYYSLEPRVSMNYMLSNTTSVKAGYARNTQNLHLMSNSTGGSPTDQWIGDSYNIRGRS